jgi:heat shock protein HtpX
LTVAVLFCGRPSITKLHAMEKTREFSRRAHKARNSAHSVILVSGMAVLTSISAWLLWGAAGVIMALASVGAATLFGPRVSPQLAMKLFRARPLGSGEAGPLEQIVAELSRRAGLEIRPRLFLLPSTILNAFAVGQRDNAAIAISAGLLNTLTTREVAGVLAHEISHIRNNDLSTMGLADMLSRLTQMMSYVGVFLFLLSLPMALSGRADIPWLAIVVLYFSPILGNLLQLALSRTREYDADLEGAHLSGDPEGLASALAKLERYQGHFWEDMLPMGRRVPVPSVLRTHPPTQERVRRLLSLEPDSPALRMPGRREQYRPAPWGLPGFVAVGQPKYHWPGVWY